MRHAQFNHPHSLHPQDALKVMGLVLHLPAHMLGGKTCLHTAVSMQHPHKCNTGAVTPWWWERGAGGWGNNIQYHSLFGKVQLDQSQTERIPQFLTNYNMGHETASLGMHDRAPHGVHMQGRHCDSELCLTIQNRSEKNGLITN